MLGWTLPCITVLPKPVDLLKDLAENTENWYGSPIQFIDKRKGSKHIPEAGRYREVTEVVRT